MIPTLIVFGLVVGRWWRFCLLTAAVGWPALLVVSDTMDLEWGLASASVLAVSNTLVGLLVHQGILFLVRQARRHELTAIR
jgi:hypothetical protein